MSVIGSSILMDNGEINVGLEFPTWRDSAKNHASANRCTQSNFHRVRWNSWSLTNPMAEKSKKFPEKQKKNEMKGMLFQYP